MYEEIIGIALFGIGILSGVFLSFKGRRTPTDIPRVRETEQRAEEGIERAVNDNRQAREGTERAIDNNRESREGINRLTENNVRAEELIQRGKEILGIKDGDNQ